jgi:hypothetical protein
MSPEILRPDSEDAVPSPTQEVEFALMLSRVIDSVRKNPEYLRATIYELARHKLKEQFETESFADARRLSKSLEIAIQGVEAFNKKKEEREGALQQLDAPQQKSLISAHVSRHDVTPVVQPTSPAIEVQASAPKSSSARERPSRSKATVSWFASVFAIALAVAFAIVSLDLLGNKGNIVINKPTSILPKVDALASPQAAPTAAETRLATQSSALPSSFGIYAVSDDKLYELDLLPGRAPDARVAISALITSQSHTTLPDGHLTFIVYRRDSATSAADRAEVRLTARIERETSYKDGKPVVTSVDDNWVMRNISIPYRTAPKKDNPDMYEVRSENPDVPLAPGRYVLVLKGQAYDFSVAGPVTDPRQCLERLVADNGQFYSECKSR